MPGGLSAWNRRLGLSTGLVSVRINNGMSIEKALSPKRHLGDITAKDFTERAALVDLLVAGTPCQAFSVAGLRGSLADTRGNLTLRFVEIVHAIRPRITLWENVPGVLSTDDNAFGCFLAGLVGANDAG